MSDVYGCGGILGENSEILFFILIFLCLFYNWGSCGRKC